MACVNPYKISVFFDRTHAPADYQGILIGFYNMFIYPFMNKKMTHCFAVCCYETNHGFMGVYIETNMYSTVVQVIDRKTLYGFCGKYPSIDIDNPARMVKIQDKATFPMNTCVGSVKKMLGIKAWWVQTPYQLYKYLLKLKGQTNDDS